VTLWRILVNRFYFLFYVFKNAKRFYLRFGPPCGRANHFKNGGSRASLIGHAAFCNVNTRTRHSAGCTRHDSLQPWRARMVPTLTCEAQKDGQAAKSHGLGHSIVVNNVYPLPSKMAFDPFYWHVARHLAEA
jgi:hypothetical protein